jgi:hypothetical protein
MRRISGALALCAAIAAPAFGEALPDDVVAGIEAIVAGEMARSDLPGGGAGGDPRARRAGPGARFGGSRRRHAAARTRAAGNGGSMTHHTCLSRNSVPLRIGHPS